MATKKVRRYKRPSAPELRRIGNMPLTNPVEFDVWMAAVWSAGIRQMRHGRKIEGA